MMTLPPYPKSDAPEWKGYTLEELRMRRALVLARMEIEKYRMKAISDGWRDNSFLSASNRSIFTRVAGVFSFAEYAVLAFKLVRMVRPLFRRSRK